MKTKLATILYWTFVAACCAGAVYLWVTYVGGVMGRQRLSGTPYGAAAERSATLLP